MSAMSRPLTRCAAREDDSVSRIRYACAAPVFGGRVGVWVALRFEVRVSERSRRPRAIGHLRLASCRMRNLRRPILDDGLWPYPCRGAPSMSLHIPPFAAIAAIPQVSRRAGARPRRTLRWRSTEECLLSKTCGFVGALSFPVERSRKRLRLPPRPKSFLGNRLCADLSCIRTNM
jgi:hypothetical protein